MVLNVGDRIRINSLKRNEINRIKKDLRDRDLEVDRKGHIVPKGFTRTNTGRFIPKSAAFRRKGVAFEAGSDEVLGEAIKRGEQRQAADVLNRSSGVFEDAEGKRFSKAPSLVAREENLRSVEGKFVDERGLGFSSAPSLVVTDVAHEPFGRKTLTFADDRKEVVDTGTINVFGSEMALHDADGGIAPTFKAPSRNIFVKGFKFAGKVKDELGMGIRDTFFPLTSFGERRFNPGREFDFIYERDSFKDKGSAELFLDFPKKGDKTLKFVPEKTLKFFESDDRKVKLLVDFPKKGDKTLKLVPSATFFDVPVIGPISKQATDFFMEKPLDVVIDYVVLKGIGKIAGSIPFVVKGLASKPVRVGIGGAFATSVVIKADVDPTGFKSSLGEEIVRTGVGLKGFASGLKSGSPTIKNLIRPSPKGLKVKTVEAVKVNTFTKDLGGNVLDFSPLTGKPTIIGGTFKSRGGGLFQVKKRVFKVGFKEKGTFVNLPEGGIASRSKANIDIQEFKHFINPRSPFKVKLFTRPKGVKFTPETIKGTQGLNVKFQRLPKHPKGIILGQFEAGITRQGYYNPSKNIIKLNKKFIADRKEISNTFIHEATHQFLLESNVRSDSPPLSSRAYRYGNVKFINRVAKKIVKDWRKLSKGKPLVRETFKENLEVIGTYPKSQRFEELIVRFIAENPKELIKPTTRTGLTYKNVFEGVAPKNFFKKALKNPIKFVAAESKILRKSFVEIAPEINRLPLGKSNVDMTTISKFAPSDKGFKVDSLSVVKGKGIGFKRVVTGDVVVGDSNSVFRGLSADFPLKGGFKNFRIGGSEKFVRGESKLLFSKNVGDVTESISSGRVLSRNVNKALGNVRKDFFSSIDSNVKKFQKEEFVSSAESLLGLKKVSKVSPPTINQAVLKDLVAKEYAKSLQADVLRSELSVKSPIVKTISSTVVDKSKGVSSVSVSVSRNSLGGNVLKSRPSIVSAIVPRLDVTPRSSLRVRNVVKQEGSLKPKAIVSQVNRLVPKQVVKQSQKVVSKQVTRQFTRQAVRSRISIFRPSTPITPTTPIIPNFNIKPVRVPKKSSVKKSLKKFRAGYNPSIEAALFDVRASKVNISLGQTGLVLRPILSGGK